MSCSAISTAAVCSRPVRSSRGSEFSDTVEYLGERYTDLDAEQLGELKEIGLRFCRPAKPYGVDTPETESEPEAEAAAA